MPTYEYRCGTCNHQFEVFARMSDPDPERCEFCGASTLEKVLFPVAVHYKGSGFYSTDYSSGSKTSSSSDGGSSDGSTSSTSDAGSSSDSASSDSGSSSSSSDSSSGSSSSSSSASD
jgi:putative FmdB family regulatory protein